MVQGNAIWDKASKTIARCYIVKALLQARSSSSLHSDEAEHTPLKPLTAPCLAGAERTHPHRMGEARKRDLFVLQWRSPPKSSSM